MREEAILVGVGDGDGRDCGGGRHCEVGLIFFLYERMDETSERSEELQRRKGGGAAVVDLEELALWLCASVGQGERRFQLKSQSVKETKINDAD